MSDNTMMLDSQGRLVPRDRVRVVDQIRDDLVKKLVADAALEQAGMIDFKKKVSGEVYTFVELVANEHGVTLGGKKGNISLVSYDGCQKVVVSVAEHISFDESLQAAKKIIDELLHQWTEGGNENLKAVVMDAFRVDQKGKISIPRLLGLRRLEISDQRWKEAMDIISDSVQVIGSKSYIRFYERKNPESDWRAIPLDMAKLVID